MQDTQPDTPQRIFDRRTVVELLEEMLRRTEGMTQEKMAEQLGYSTRGAVNLVLKGKRRLAPQAAERLGSLLKLRGLERTYFDLLVQMHRAPSPDIESRLSAARRRADRIVKDGSFRPHPKKWLHNVVREMFFVKLKPQSEEGLIKWIQNRLRFPVSQIEVKEVLTQIRDSEGMIESEMGERPEKQFLETTGNIRNEERREYHRQTLNLAKRALEDIPLEIRKFRALVLPVRKEAIEQIRERINEFTREIDEKYSAQEGDEVYSLHVTFFPMTKGEDENVLVDH